MLFFLWEENGFIWIFMLSFASVFNIRWILLFIISILLLCFWLFISLIWFFILFDDVDSFFKDSLILKFSVFIISLESIKSSSLGEIIWLFAVYIYFLISLEFSLKFDSSKSHILISLFTSISSLFISLSLFKLSLSFLIWFFL